MIEINAGTAALRELKHLRGASMAKATSTLCLMVMLAAFIVRSDPAAAATVTVMQDQGAYASVVLEGIIAPGDLDRVNAAAGRVRADGKLLGGVVLNSAGGNFGEAEKLAQMLYGARAAGSNLSAIVRGNGVCASACFLLFACAPQRYANVTAHIGVHSARNPNDNSEDVGSYVVDTWMGRLAKQCGVPDYLIGKMVTTRADSTYWLSPRDLLAMGVHVVMQNGQELSPPVPQASAPAAPPTLTKCSESMRLGCALYALGGGDVFYCMRQKALLYGCHW